MSKFDKKNNKQDDSASESDSEKSINLFILDPYSEKSLLVYGEDTKKYSKQLKKIGGKFGMNFKVPSIKGVNVPGWIFSMNKKEEVYAFYDHVTSGDI